MSEFYTRSGVAECVLFCRVPGPVRLDTRTLVTLPAAFKWANFDDGMHHLILCRVWRSETLSAMKLFAVIAIFTCSLTFSEARITTHRNSLMPRPCATCTGGNPCYACKNCHYCKHCAQQGGTCGVCRP